MPPREVSFGNARSVYAPLAIIWWAMPARLRSYLRDGVQVLTNQGGDNVRLALGDATD